MEQTLRQMCAELKISRRSVQGYEKAGLVAPSGKNKYGYLLYGETERERIRLIRFYQQMEFRLREIRELMDADDSIKKEAFQAKILVLEEKQMDLQELIRKAREYIAAL